MNLRESNTSVAMNPLNGAKESPELLKENYSPFAEWLLENKATVSLDPRSEEEKFVDQNGVVRYVDNWLPASTGATFNLLNHTGCIEKSLDFLMDSEVSNTEKKPEIRFLTDWKQLWDYFDNDNVDEIATQIPLLRIFVEFFFHRRTSIFVVGLTVYLLAFQLTLTIIYNVLPSVIRPVAIIYYLCELTVYLAMRVLFKGSMFGEPHHYHDLTGLTPTGEEKEHEAIEAEKQNKKKKKKGLVYRYSVHWSSSFVHLIKHSWKDLKLLCSKENRQAKKTITKKNLTYYELLNISLKFLIRMNGLNLKKVNFNRRTYRCCLLAVLFIYPLYIYFSQYCPYYKYYSICPKGTMWYDPHADSFCKWYTWDLILSLAGILPAMLNYMFGGSVLIALVALAYGGEINYRLTICWINRFKSLQRIEEPNVERNQFGNEESKSNVIKDSPTGRGNDVEAGVNIDSKLAEFVQLVSVDAREHYMFLREYMNQAGKLWSFGLVGIFVLFLFICVVTLYFATIGGTLLLIARLVLALSIKFLILVIYPIVSISHANNFVFDLQEIFTIAAPEDFPILGGKEKWINLFTIAPAVWTVFGLWITYEKLFAFIWTIVSSAAAVGIALVTSTN